MKLRHKDDTMLIQSNQWVAADNSRRLLTRIRDAAKAWRTREADLSAWVADLDEVIAEVEDKQSTPDWLESELAQIQVDDPAPVRANLACKFPQKSAKRKLRSVSRDARNIKKCRALSNLGVPTQQSATSGPLVHRTTHPSHTPNCLTVSRQSPYSPSYQKHLLADRNDRRKIAAWRNTGDLSKMFAVGQAISEGGATAFSLNLAGRVKARVDARPTDALSYLSDRLVKALKAEFGHRVEVAFALEASPAGNVHVHGILDLDPVFKDRARRALEKAGGQWAGKGREYQADARRLWDASGWTNYCSKALARTKRALGLSNVLSITNDLRRRAKGYWEGMRRTESLSH